MLEDPDEVSPYVCCLSGLYIIRTENVKTVPLLKTMEEMEAVAGFLLIYDPVRQRVEELD